MGTKERRQREFEARERLFLDAARKLIRQEGILALQMARLARACDYATGTLYQHFSAKEDLLVALATRRLEEHADYFCQAAAWKAGTRERMFALTVADYNYAQRHPGFSRLLQYAFTEVIWEGASEERRQAMQSALQPPARAVRAIVQDAIEAGDLPDRGLDAGALMLGPWGLSAGIQSMMQTHGLLDGLGIREPGLQLYRHAQFLLNGLGWKPLMDPVDETALAALVQRIEQDVLATDQSKAGPAGNRINP
ncbi:MAG: TetR/AcrR family transcriptional regulator [Wenzhouxiangella sp.]|nr:MAG: TetR/AcrR family transcriptional regulator [Wenzhouxiangella sp.]